MKDSFNKLRDVDSRISVMINDLLTARDSGSGRVAESSFKRIPSVKSFKVKVGEQNELLFGTGLERKLPADFKYILFKEQNRANRYMEIRIKAMRAVLKKNLPHIFWAMVQNEMKHSVCFRSSSFNAVFPGWYKNMDFQRAVQINFGVEHILKNEITELKYFRVEIPKGSPEEIAEWFKNNPGQNWPGKTRPLGVPTAPWRVVLHMWNGFLTIFLEEEIKKFNHAYMPNRGTLTAIKDFLGKVRHHKYIYEFDIEGFFNNVGITDTIRRLKERGMSLMTSELEKILRSCPQNIETSWTKKPGEILSYDEKLGLRKFVQKSEAESSAETENDWDSYDELGESYEELNFRFDRIEQQKQHAKSIEQDLDKGLPQGAAPSTILSLLSLTDWAKELEAKGIGLLMYADDGILYANEEFSPSPPEGFNFAEGKSRWIKRQEILENELKFLGIKYNFKTRLIRGHTRNGSTLEFGFEQENFFEYLRKIVPRGYGGDLMDALIKSSIFGLTLSKLYGGKFGNLKYDEDVKYNKKSYWARYHNLDQLQKSSTLQKTASTTACGWLLLLNNHIISGKDRNWFYEEAKKYHELKPWEINEKDIKAALDWQSTWDKKHWPHQGSAD
jgi:hypothetical protein